MSSKGKVAVDLQQLHKKFTSIITNVRTCLAEAINTGRCQLEVIALFVEEYVEETKLASNVTTIQELFHKARSHYCFLNCELIENLVE